MISNNIKQKTIVININLPKYDTKRKQCWLVAAQHNRQDLLGRRQWLEEKYDEGNNIEWLDDRDAHQAGVPQHTFE